MQNNQLKEYETPKYTFLILKNEDVITASFGIDFDSPGSDFGWGSGAGNLGWGN